MVGILLLILAHVGGTSPRCDLVEINHYQPDGNTAFVQLIAWDWDSHYQRWHAQQWAMVGEWQQIPGGVSVRSHDSEAEIVVKAAMFRETWTEHDPERVNQAVFPTSERRRVW